LDQHGHNRQRVTLGSGQNTTYYWQVRAVNDFGMTYGDGSNTTFRSFTTGVMPGAFAKSLPTNSAPDQPLNATLSWSESNGAEKYQYCLVTTSNNHCPTSKWTDASTTVSLSGLDQNQTYYWQVRAVNNIGTTYADGSNTAFWSFTTGATVAVPVVTISATIPTANEAGPTSGQFTVTRTGPTTAALAVFFTVGGSATAGDYTSLATSVTIPIGSASAVITVTPVNDTEVEADETVVVSLGANAAYTIGASGSATVTIVSDDVAPLPSVTIIATDDTATEAGPTAGQYTVTRTGPTTSALTVNFSVGGTATAGSDYAVLGTSVTIPAAAASATLTVTRSTMPRWRATRR